MRLSGKIVGAVLSMRNHLDKRVLRRAWTTKPSDRESAFPDAVELVNHPTGYKGLQLRCEQLGPLRGQPGPANPFCHGERGDVGRSRMPIDRSLRTKSL